MTYWYIATPYSKYEGGHLAAYEEACRQTALILEAGIPAFSPIAHTHGISVYVSQENRYSHDFWLDVVDKPMMRAASGLLVVKLNGWNESRGVADEIKFFSARYRPIVFMEPGIIPDLSKHGI